MLTFAPSNLAMNKVLASILELAVKESLSNYESKGYSNSLEGLYLYYDKDDNLLTIYDDANRVLNEVHLPNDQYFNLAHILRQVLQQAGKNRLFERSYIVKPFTISLVDKDFVVLEELFYLDDDSVKKSGVIWANIEKDLDDFIENLLQ